MFGHVLVITALNVAQIAADLVRRDQTFATSNRDSTYDQSFGITGQLTTVNAGVYRWLSGGSTHNFYGNLNNYGSITISQTDYLITTPSAGGQTADFVGHDVNNGNVNNYGSISLNDYGSASAPTYDWYLRTMENAGSMQWCGRGDTGGSTYQLYCDNTCYNDGVLDWEQYTSNLGASFNWRNTNLYPQGTTVAANIYNNGAVRLVNVNFQAVQNVLGTGCWILGGGSTLYMQDGTGVYQNPGYGATFPNQNIYFRSNNATLHMDTQVYSHNSNFGPQLYGFTNGNAIEFYETISTFSYDVTTGVLTVTMTSTNTVLIKLGVGYTASAFSKASHPSKYNVAGYNAIFYSGTAPSQILPSKCSVSMRLCADPATTATNAPYSTTTLAYTGTQTLTGPITQTIAPASGTAIGTVAVYTPAGSYTTITQLYSGSLTGTSTSTAATAVGTVPGTIVIYTPASYITTTQLYTGAGTLTGPTTSTVAQASGTAPGTVVVFTPGTYITTSVAYTGTDTITAPVTSTIAKPSGTTPGTIAIYTPVSATFVTTTLVYTGTGTISGPLTSTIAPQAGTTPGTVAVFTPAAPKYITTVVPYTGTSSISGPITSTIAPQVGNTPGTVVVYTPTTQISTTSITSGVSSTTTSTTSRPATLRTALGPDMCVCIPA